MAESTEVTTTKSYFYYAFIPFIIITLIFSYFKPRQKKYLNILSEYNTLTYWYTFGYFLALILIQTSIGWTVIAASGCNITKDKGKIIGEVFKVTIIPWVFIYGFALVIILLKPKFKSVFSNVYGYMRVSSQANINFTELLENKKQVKQVTNFAPSDTDKESIQLTADSILKICGNTSILINQITPDNFIEYMLMLKPLMKTIYGEKVTTDFFSNTGTEFFSDKQNLFYKIYDLVEKRDSVGEMSWYIYTALLVIAIITYNIANIPCN